MAVVDVNRGGVDWKCITPSETPTWRMFWHSSGIVTQIFEDTEESLTLAVDFAFEGATKQECIDKANELELELIDEVIEG